MDDLKSLKKDLVEIRSMLKNFSPARFDVPVSLSRAAEICEMNRDTLLDLVQRKDVKAYRPGPKQPWRVIPADVLAYLTRETNLEQPRRKSVLRALNTDANVRR